MDQQTMINAAFGLIAFLGGWVVRNLQESMASLRTADEHLASKVQSIEVLVAGTYVKRDDIDKLTTALFTKLDRIESKVDKKLDRDDCPGCKP
jgi:hypothetical protein